MRQIKRPTLEDRTRSLDIRKRSKQGISISSDERRFNRKIFVNYEEWYQYTEAEVFNDTVPFGSGVRKQNKEEVEWID